MWPLIRPKPWTWISEAPWRPLKLPGRDQKPNKYYPVTLSNRTFIKKIIRLAGFGTVVVAFKSRVPRRNVVTRENIFNEKYEGMERKKNKYSRI